MLPLHAYRRSMEKRILGQVAWRGMPSYYSMTHIEPSACACATRVRVLGQYGDELHEEQLWELASGDQMQSLGLSQSDDFVTREVCHLPHPPHHAAPHHATPPCTAPSPRPTRISRG